MPPAQKPMKCIHHILHFLQVSLTFKDDVQGSEQIVSDSDYIWLVGLQSDWPLFQTWWDGQLIWMLFVIVQTKFSSDSESLLAPKIPSQLSNKRRYDKTSPCKLACPFHFLFYSKLHKEFWDYVCTVWYSHFRGELIKFAINLSGGRFLESRRRCDRLDFSQVVKYEGGGSFSFSRHTNPSFYLSGRPRKVDFFLLKKPSQENGKVHKVNVEFGLRLQMFD